MRILDDKEREQRRATILRETSEMLAMVPFRDVSLRIIAESSGFNNAMVLYLFGRKDAILAELLMTEYQRWAAAVLKAMVPFRDEATRQLIIRYAQQELVFAHLMGLLDGGLDRRLWHQAGVNFRRDFPALERDTAQQLDDGVNFFLPGDGLRFLQMATAILAANHGRNLPPEYASQAILGYLAGLRTQFTRRNTALEKKRPLTWGDALAE